MGTEILKPSFDTVHGMKKDATENAGGDGCNLRVADGDGVRRSMDRPPRGGTIWSYILRSGHGADEETVARIATSAKLPLHRGGVLKGRSC